MPSRNFMTPSRNILIYETPEQVAQAAAESFVRDVQAAVTANGWFSVALSGGNTPKRVYALLATEDFAKRIEWSKVHIFFGDERCVPPDHPDSNYRMALESLISRVPIPADNVHRIVGEGDPVKNARLYEDLLKTFFAGQPWPRFDLVLLGMGDDGHTASLFPYTSAVKEKEAWVVANWVSQMATWRISLTAPAINHARHIMFLVTGPSKAERVAEVLRATNDWERLPARLIKPVAGILEWLLDTDAASRLNQEVAVKQKT
jgi:6-phosphogluconolactonase